MVLVVNIYNKNCFAHLEDCCTKQNVVTLTKCFFAEQRKVHNYSPWLIWNSDIILCFTYYFCLSSWFFKYLQFYSPSFYKKGEGLGSLTSLNMAAILNFAEKFIYLYIEIKLVNIDIRVSAKYYLHVAYEVI